MRRSNRLSLLASTLLLLTAGLGRPVLCVEADGLLRLESGVAADDCCASEAGAHAALAACVVASDCGCTDSDVALAARPSGPSADWVPAGPPAVRAVVPSRARSEPLAEAAVPSRRPRTIVLRL